MCLNFFELYNLPPGSEIIRENYYITASLSFLEGVSGRKLIGFGKCCSAFRPFSPGLDNQVDFHDSIIERIVNFYHAHENFFDYITTYL